MSRGRAPSPMPIHPAHESEEPDAILSETLRGRVTVLADDDEFHARLCDCLGAVGVRSLAGHHDLELPNHSIDLAVMDANDDKVDRWALGWLRRRDPEHAPGVFALATRHDPARAARWLNAGVEDLMFCPFEPQEFRARVRAVLRHRHARWPGGEQLKLAGFELDRRREVLVDQGKPVELSRREFALAWLFFSQPNMVLSRAQITWMVWGSAPDVAGRSLEQHISRIRAKLHLNEPRGVVIRSVYAQGYRLELTGHILKSL